VIVMVKAFILNYCYIFACKEKAALCVGVI
jgi:hypothetical protein